MFSDEEKARRIKETNAKAEKYLQKIREAHKANSDFSALGNPEIDKDVIGFDSDGKLIRGEFEDFLQIKPEVKQKIKALSSAINKLPSFRGIVHRGGEIPSEILARYVPGETIREITFTSASAEPKLRFDGNTYFVIKSQFGRDISSFSQLPHEKEVVFDKGTHFLVVDNQYSKALNKQIIILVDISEAYQKSLIDETKAEAANYITKLEVVPQSETFSTLQPDKYSFPVGIRESTDLVF